MSSVQIDRPTKMGNINKKENEKSRKLFNPSHKKHKHEDSRHFKFGRKRSQSFINNGKFFVPYKRRKKEGIIIPPTKFLLGGNICDPLNLNSMQDEEVNRAMNAVTPKSSPLPTPKHKKEAIEVIIPPNICDPLNLTNCNDNEEYEKQLISPTKKGSKRRNRKRKRASSISGKKENASETNDIKMKDNNTELVETIIEQYSTEKVSAELQALSVNTLLENNSKETKLESPQKDKNRLRLKGLEEAKDKRLRKVDTKDKIVSPVIPQPGAWKPRLQHRPSQDKKKKQFTTPNFRQKDARYQYGNYNRYYGYRNLHHDVDTRLTAFAQRKKLFMQKDILDIGCNIGHITLSIARDFGARSVTGIDIDRTLINIARKNVKHYVNYVQSPAPNEDNDQQDSDANFFPMSMPINYGPVDIPGFTKNKHHKGFPYNVTFVQGNYVLDDDALLYSEQPQFDTILCLSITKWIHLNFGDAGLKQTFKRMHAQLRPNGVLVLEPQGWSGYNKKKNLTERIYKNYHSIEFRPQNFTQYLLSPEVGFCKCEVISTPPHPSKGFQRPIHLFTKAGPSTTDTEDLAVNTSSRYERKDQELLDMERMKYEQELFPKDTNKLGNMSEISQQSNDLNQYEQLEKVYAPSATPCYDTPGHNNDGQPLDALKMCYVDVGIHDNKEIESSESIKSNESINHASSDINKSDVNLHNTDSEQYSKSPNTHLVVHKSAQKRNRDMIESDVDEIQTKRLRRDEVYTNKSDTDEGRTKVDIRQNPTTHANIENLDKKCFKDSDNSRCSLELENKAHENEVFDDKINLRDVVSIESTQRSISNEETNDSVSFIG